MSRTLAVNAVSRGPLAAVIDGITALVLVGLLTGGVLLAGTAVPLSLVPIIYLVPVVIAAARSGFWPAALAATAGAAAADFFFTRPYYSLRIDDPRKIGELLIFIAVALVCSRVAALVRKEADLSRRRAQQIGSLYEFSRQLARCTTVNDLLGATERYVSRELGRPAALVAAPGDQDLPARTSDVPDSIRRESLSLIGQNDLELRMAVDPRTNSRWMLKPLVWQGIHHGVIAVDIGHEIGTPVDQDMARIETAAEEAAMALARMDIGHAMQEAQSRRQDELLKDALHGIVSHELRTPLASILGAASVLEASPDIAKGSTAQSLIEGIHEDASHLDGFLKTLITASRVNAFGVQPRLDWVDPADIMNAALTRRAQRLGRHRLVTTIGSDLPLVHVDPVMIEEACGQLLDNAAKYSAVGSPIRVEVGMNAGQVTFQVTDEGSGLAPEEIAHLGRRSFRGERHRQATPGFGLGLWIASAFVRANGGVLSMANRDQGQGTAASISLPTAEADAPENDDMDIHD